jgi:N-acetylmuramoyl-L-alanine amidase
MRIVLSIGHDPKTVGATNKRGDKENSLCAAIVVATKQELLNLGVEVVVIPDLPLGATVDYINQNFTAKDVIAIEIHKDACGDIYNDKNMYRRCGFYHTKGSTKTQKICEHLTATFKKEGAHETSWTRPDDANAKTGGHPFLAFCRNITITSIIAELGFIEGSNSQSENDWYAKTLAKAIYAYIQSLVTRSIKRGVKIPRSPRKKK